MEDVLIPIALFAMIAAISIAAFYFGHRKRQLAYDAVKSVVEKTGTLDAALVDIMVKDRISPNADLRKGIILVTVAVAFIILGYSIPEEEAFEIMRGVASFPGLIGLAYVGFHFFAPREETV